MPFFNDLDLTNWKDAEIWTDSLWLIPARDKTGKHNGFYHGNFVPQIPRQLILRYTKKNEIVFDPFAGSGTTAYEAERLTRGFIGVEIQKHLVEYVNCSLDKHNKNLPLICLHGDSTESSTFEKVRKLAGKTEKIHLAILHPPYGDIIKFSDHPKDLSNARTLKEFLFFFQQVLLNTKDILEEGRYLAIVIGDMYTKGEWIPLGFYCMNEAQKIGFRLKSIVVKNMEGNRAKNNKQAIWRYRALSSDYYIFKHEYILLFKKGK